ncbi:MAG: metalloregulator ArsR/SmtB family transcription factor [Dehalococcoidia bacterium]|nr:metalloregulator ArsR/SmtB family transcription factor [Dehalococcoidia bacterium]
MAIDWPLLERQAALCQTLADPTRLAILHLLADGPRPVKALVEATGQRQTKVSQHLAVLRGHGVVTVQRVGVEAWYAIADRRLLDACATIRDVLIEQWAHQGALAARFAPHPQGGDR